MIDFSLLDDKKSIWISVSGGTDSALLLYLVTKYLHDTNSTAKLTPWVYVDLSRPGNDNDVQLIIDCIQSICPYPYEPTIVNTFFKPPGGDKPGLTKPFWDILARSTRFDVYMNALSNSPSEEEMIKTPGFYEAFKKVGPEDRLPTEQKKTVSYSTKLNLTILTPFINLNKQNLADIYEECGLMDNLFPLTKSCVARASTPCYNCFWCYEKHWAFGMYDIKHQTFNLL